MPIRHVKQNSERGSIKNLMQRQEDEVELTSTEKRFKQLWDYACENKDVGIQNALGIITTDYIGDKNALPLSIYRIRKIVEDIKSRPGSRVSQLQEEFAGLIQDNVSPLLAEQMLQKKMIKTAGKRKPPVFRRVSVE